MKKRVLIIGWDCAAPELVFDEFRDAMPNTQTLMQGGIYGELESTIPPITVPAWMCMMTGRSPGELGIYGFRNRQDYSYDNLYIVNSSAVKVPTLWDILGSYQKKSVVLGVPLTYPPKPFQGWMVTSFLTPNKNAQWTFPHRLKHEISEVAEDYMIDIPNFRTDLRAELERNLFKMTEARFKLARHLLHTKAWDLFAMVEMGPDRLHHAFWRFSDKTHPKHEPNSPFADTMHRYYAMLDAELGRILERIDEHTTVMIVSDHGAKRMDGGICVNEWLQRHGYLTLKAQPKAQTPFNPALVDWEKTQAWGEGGYYGRIFMNVKGREPCGIVEPEDYEKRRDELKTALEAITDENGKNIGTHVFKPEEVYEECQNIPPDLIVYFGELSWRSVGSVGYNSIYTYENDTGPDDCNHAQMGMFIIKTGNGCEPCGRVSPKSLYDIAPTVLTEFGIEVPHAMRGEPIFSLGKH